MANQYREARAKESSEMRGPYKKLHHIEIEPIKGENGGHIVTHHYHQDGSSGGGLLMRHPVAHMFGKDGYSNSDMHMFEHLAKHLKVPLPHAEPSDTHKGESEEHEGPTSKYQAAAEPIDADVDA